MYYVTIASFGNKIMNIPKEWSFMPHNIIWELGSELNGDFQDQCYTGDTVPAGIQLVHLDLGQDKTTQI